MIRDPTDRYIAAITGECDLAGKTVLEVGCGTGRITRDLSIHAARVVAVDPDSRAVELARQEVRAPTVEFRHMPAGVLDFPPGSFDVVIYTLSLHHLPPDGMVANLRTAASLLRQGGVIIILEPDDGGLFTLAKEQFGAGSVDERQVRAAGIRATHALEGWAVGETLHFRTLFLFVDEEEFLHSMLPGWRGSRRPLSRGCATLSAITRRTRGSFSMRAAGSMSCAGYELIDELDCLGGVRREKDAVGKTGQGYQRDSALCLRPINLMKS